MPTNQSDFYGKYLLVPNTPSNPSPAYKGTWDMAVRGLGSGLVRELGADLLQPAVLEPGRIPGQRRQ